ncbi:MAG: hypothetical protein NTV68_13985 [Methanomicrobiales archaeon]|nr:hypothetical protein [Methanomicrobiales archaeon]
MGCTQTTTSPVATLPSTTTQVTTPAPVATQALAQATTIQASAQGDADKYVATSRMLVSEVNQVVQYMGTASSKLAAITTAEQLSGALPGVSSDLREAKLHVQTAQGLAQDLTRYATTPGQQQESRKILTDLGYLENALTSMNAAVEEVQKPSPDIALMEAKIKESNDWLARIV